jgi:hypothetical protein
MKSTPVPSYRRPPFSHGLTLILPRSLAQAQDEREHCQTQSIRRRRKPNCNLRALTAILSDDVQASVTLRVAPATLSEGWGMAGVQFFWSSERQG